VAASVRDPLADRYGTKPAAVLAYLREALANGEDRVLVFSQWASCLALLDKTLRQAGVPAIRLDALERSDQVLERDRELAPNKTFYTLAHTHNA